MINNTQNSSQGSPLMQQHKENIFPSNNPLYQNQMDIMNSLMNFGQPINEGYGGQQEEQKTKELEKILDKYWNSPLDKDKEERDSAISTLMTIVQQWIYKVAIKQGQSEEIASKSGGQLLVYGSYKLKVYAEDSDIDTVAVVPKFVERETNFFGDLVEMLKARSELKEIFCIKEALVPLIKMKFCNFQFDILFSQMTQDTVDPQIKDELLNNATLQQFDPMYYRSFNGIRVAQYMVTKIRNKLNFTITLKCVKLWAKNRGIYSQILGFLGGIAWTILVAQICQLYPNYPPAKLLDRFFFIYSKWSWNDCPVQIQDVQEQPQFSLMNQDQWKRDVRDKNSSPMMIITPCFPCINCAHSVSTTNLSIIKEQLNQANEIMIKIQKKKYLWERLFKQFKFFKKYNHFVQIKMISQNKNDFIIWRGHMQSRLRKLTRLIESLREKILLHPHSQIINSKENIHSFSTRYYLGIKILSQEEVDLRQPIRQFCETLESAEKLPEGISFTYKYLIKEQLPEDLLENSKQSDLASRQYFNPSNSIDPESQEIQKISNFQLNNHQRNDQNYKRPKRYQSEGQIDVHNSGPDSQGKDKQLNNGEFNFSNQNKQGKQSLNQSQIFLSPQNSSEQVSPTSADQLKNSQNGFSGPSDFKIPNIKLEKEITE